MCDQMREEKLQLQEALEQTIAQDKLMEVCEICGCFLIVGDTDQRIGEHLLGKQHMGYAKIRTTIEELQVGGAVIFLLYSFVFSCWLNCFIAFANFAET